jgi:hypothetical protein
MSLTPMDKIKWLFIMVMVSYAVALPTGANFGVIDDHEVLDSLLSGRTLDFYVNPEIGRFFPLDGQEYNIISLFSLSPVAFYTYNMVQFLIVVFLMLKIVDLCLAGVNKNNLAYIIVLLVIFSPGFVSAWFRLLMGERGQVLFFLIFFLLYLLYQKEQKVIYFISGFLAANLALYYKEPGFLMLGALGFFHLAFGWKILNKRQKLFDALLMASATIFVMVYFFVIFLKKGHYSYGDTPYSFIIVFTKNTFNYVLSDPFLIILLFVLVIYRFYVILMKKEHLDALHDATLLSGTIYVLAFLKLNIWSYHYLLPAYVFATFGIVHFLVKEKYINRIVIKAAVCIALVLFIFNALPVGIHLISSYKNIPNNFQNTLTYLTDYIRRDRERVTIYLDGVDRGNSMEVYYSFIKYLAYKHVNPDQFDLKSDIPSNNALLFSKGDPQSPFTVFRDPTPTQIEAGDLLLVTPYTVKFVDQRYIDNLMGNYELLYHAESILAIPNIGMKSLIKYLVMRPDRQPIHEIMFSTNIFAWPDFYIFRKKRKQTSL